MSFSKYSNEQIHFFNNEIPEHVKKILENQKGVFSLADVGCGEGRILNALKNLGFLDDAGEVFGVDISEKRLERMERITGYKSIHSDGSNISEFEDQTMDIVLSNQVIEHVTNDVIFLKELKRILKHDGYLFISSVVKRKTGWYFYKNDGRWVLDPTHVREYRSTEEFIKLVKSQGFEIVYTKSFTPKMSILNFILRTFNKIIQIKDLNQIYLKYRFVGKVSRLSIPIFGYEIIEVTAKKINGEADN